jgi:chorismate lyase/3-hydroxybenzoate synthase
MTQTFSALSVPLPALCAEEELLPPAWVGRLLGARSSNLSDSSAGDLSLDTVRSDHFCLVSVRAREARGLGRAAFQELTARAYRRLEAELRGGPTPHPVRLWNHIPGIHDDLGDGQSRYMVFNAGRIEALAAWLGGAESFDTRVASASGTGHDGQDLVLHCLAADQPGRAVANPRQIAPYRYSRRYGPQPPCFARATVIEPPLHAPEGMPLVLVGGTASIVGEESVHPGDVARQMEETLINLAVLLRSAAGETAGETAGEPFDGTDRASLRAALAAFRELRVYVPDPALQDEIRGSLQDAIPGLEQIEWIRADLCRADLLVEIEGMAELGAQAPPTR